VLPFVIHGASVCDLSMIIF